MPGQPQELSIELGLDEPMDDAHLRARVAAQLGLSQEAVPAVTLRKRSIDARRGSVKFVLQLELGAAALDRPACFAPTSWPGTGSAVCSWSAASQCNPAATISKGSTG
jgi:hypothetical protein